LFYIFFIVVGAWRYGKTEAWASTIFAIVAWVVGESPWNNDQVIGIFIWNGVGRLVIFGFIAASVSEMKAVRDSLARANRQLSILADENEALARMDPLTQLANSRMFHERLAYEAARHKRNKAALCLAYIDLDNFKMVNDKLGHTGGDKALVEVAKKLKQSVRQVDIVARLGGDEFAIIFVEAAPEKVQDIGERIIRHIKSLKDKVMDIPLGASIGILVIENIPDDAVSLIQIADEAMYFAKTSGKGRVSVRHI
jgi:diguanylate cyclase (GGDEF)-like protein